MTRTRVRLQFSHCEVFIPEGAVACLEGPGAAKLLRLIAGLPIPACTATATVHRESAERPATALALMPPVLLPWMTVEENIAYGLRLRRFPPMLRQDAARHFARLLDVSRHLSRSPRDMSVVLQHRTAMARALATDPEVLLFDRPEAALDAGQWRQVCREARARGQTVICTGHAPEADLAIHT